MHRRAIYGIIDLLANELVGPVQTHAHDAVAVRTFSDIALMPNSTIGRHPQDFRLDRLGWLDDENNLIADRKTILDGSTWAAAQQGSSEQQQVLPLTR